MRTPKEIVDQALAAGFSQSFLQQETGISQPTISRIKSGAHADPKSSTFAKLEVFARKFLKPAN